MLALNVQGCVPIYYTLSLVRNLGSFPYHGGIPVGDGSLFLLARMIMQRWRIGGSRPAIGCFFYGEICCVPLLMPATGGYDLYGEFQKQSSEAVRVQGGTSSLNKPVWPEPAESGTCFIQSILAVHRASSLMKPPRPGGQAGDGMSGNGMRCRSS